MINLYKNKIINYYMDENLLKQKLVEILKEYPADTRYNEDNLRDITKKLQKELNNDKITEQFVANFLLENQKEIEEMLGNDINHNIIDVNNVISNLNEIKMAMEKIENALNFFNSSLEDNFFNRFNSIVRNVVKKNLEGEITEDINRCFMLPGLDVSKIEVLEYPYINSIRITDFLGGDIIGGFKNSKKYIITSQKSEKSTIRSMESFIKSTSKLTQPNLDQLRVAKIYLNPINRQYTDFLKNKVNEDKDGNLFYYILIKFNYVGYNIDNKIINFQLNPSLKFNQKLSTNFKTYSTISLNCPKFYILNETVFNKLSNWTPGQGNDFYDDSRLGDFRVRTIKKKNGAVNKKLLINNFRQSVSDSFQSFLKDAVENNNPNIINKIKQFKEGKSNFHDNLSFSIMEFRMNDFNKKIDNMLENNEL